MWFNVDEFGLVWLSSVWFGVFLLLFGLDDFSTLREDNQDKNYKSNIR